MTTFTKYLSIFFVSMVPLIELRAAVPMGIGMGLPTLPVFVLCVLGNMLPVPIIYFFARKVLTWGTDKPVIGRFFRWCLEKGEKGGRKLQASAGRGLYWALLLFVGIPLPGTGGWTGSLVASLLKVDLKKAFPAVFLGIAVAATIMGLISYGIFHM